MRSPVEVRSLVAIDTGAVLYWSMSLLLVVVATLDDDRLLVECRSGALLDSVLVVAC